MLHSYDYLVSLNFPNGVDLVKLESDIKSNIVINKSLSHINEEGDNVMILFASELSSAENIELDQIVSNHVPDPKKIPAFLYVEDGNNILQREDDGNKISYIGLGTSEIIISADGYGTFTSIKDAVTNNGQEGALYKVRPGVYVENNPIVLPPKTWLSSEGSPGNTIIIPLNPSEDIIHLSALSIVTGFTLKGANQGNAAGFYYDGSLSGTRSYAKINKCLIDDCQYGVLMENADDMLVISDLVVFGGSTPTLAGISGKKGASIIANDFQIAGDPSKINTINKCIEAVDPDTNVTLKTGSINFGNYGMYLNNNSDIDSIQCTIRGADQAITIGATGDITRLRANALKIYDSTNYDMEVLCSDVNLNIYSGEMDNNKIHNPNGLNLNTRFHSTLTNEKLNTYTGKIQFGSDKNPSSISIGSGRHSYLTVLGNTNLESGTWTDNTSAAMPTTTTTFDIFPGTAAGNCIYLGSDSKILGIKIDLTTPCNTTIPRDNLAWEYWDGVSWADICHMNIYELEENIVNINAFVSLVAKQNLRFGLTSRSTFATKNLNGINKYWVRCRIVTDIPNIPQASYIKHHTNNTKINKNGFIEHFGDSRTIRHLPISTKNFSTVPGTAGVDSSLYISTSLSIDNKNNVFSSTGYNKIATFFKIPFDCDLSFPIYFNIFLMGDSNIPGNMFLRMTSSHITIGSAIYNNSTDAPNTPVSGETISSTTKMITGYNKLHQATLSIIPCGLEHLNQNNPLMTYIQIGRDTNDISDTYVGNIHIAYIECTYTTWCSGKYL